MKFNLNHVLTAIVCVIFCISFCTGLLAAETGGIRGMVSDINSNPIPGVTVTLLGEKMEMPIKDITAEDGTFRFKKVPAGEYSLRAELMGMNTIQRDGVKVTPDNVTVINLVMEMSSFEETVIAVGSIVDVRAPGSPGSSRYPYMETEEYDGVTSNRFATVLQEPLSTFSIDVDTASYANARRFLRDNRLPPPAAIRVEEFINYFSYDYPQPKRKSDAFAVYYEVSDCPWNEKNRLVHIGLQGRKMDMAEAPPSNFVFLIDVSGSMNSHDKLPLLKKAFQLLVQKLDEKDLISIVTYAGREGLALPATSGAEKEKILAAIENLSSGGSTAGAAGIRLAYKVAQENFIKGGNNRVILATDGDFNVGISSDQAMIELIEEKRESGVFLSTLGFGTGNIKDSKMEKLADHGNGNYSYIDSLLEARKVLVTEMGQTFYAIAKDVKIQVEFNPAKVASYRLIGYENRMLETEDFDDDTQDAGELGAGHTVTALYEIVPAVSVPKLASVPDLRYQISALSEIALEGNELLNLKLRYKEPDGDQSRLIESPLPDSTVRLKNTTNNYRFSAAVALFGMLLRNSEFTGDGTYDMVLALANGSKGKDLFGYRAEFITLVELAKLMDKPAQ